MIITIITRMFCFRRPRKQKTISLTHTIEYNIITILYLDSNSDRHGFRFTAVLFVQCTRVCMITIDTF
jgi:hypothetical protein